MREHREDAGLAGESGKNLRAEDTGYGPAHVEGPESAAKELGFILQAAGLIEDSWAEKDLDGTDSLVDKWRERNLGGLEAKDIETKNS